MATTVPRGPFPPPGCEECSEQATCAYSWGGAEHYACAVHDPTQVRGALTVRGPLTYRTPGI